jgi:hypothetical protein
VKQKPQTLAKSEVLPAHRAGAVLQLQRLRLEGEGGC